VIYGGQKLYELSPKFKSKMNILTISIHLSLNQLSLLG